MLGRWGAAVVCVALAFALNRISASGLFPGAPFVAAILIAVQVGGNGPGTLALVLSSALLDYFYIPPTGRFKIDPEHFGAPLQFLAPVAVGWWFIQRHKDIALLLARETAVATRLQGNKSFAEIGRGLLDYLAPELGAPIGALYTVDADGTSHRRAAYAFDLRAAPERIVRGHGLIGQAVAQSQTLMVEVPSSYVSVESSFGRRRPSHILILPASDGQQPNAVLELGFFRPVDRASLRLLERVAEPIAVAIRTAAYRVRLQEVLEETQRQAEELKAHEEELEERGRTMIEARRKLEDQRAELEETNEKLTQQALQLEEQNMELEQAHAEVRIKSEGVERANRSKSEFLANMSHELRTPLNSSLILAKLLSENTDGNLNDQEVKSAETIYAAGKDLLAMIDDILDLAKVEAGKIDVYVEDVPLARVRAEMLRTFEPVAAQRGIRFDVRLGDGAPTWLQTDAQRLTQILKNLLSNALKFTAQGEVTLVVTGTGPRCSFAVADTGIGIPKDELERIFEAFRQVDATSNRRYGGTGLGLSISRELAHLLGGEISVSSQLARGSTFTLDLPASWRSAPSTASNRRAVARATPPPMVASTQARDSHPAGPDSRAVLIVEDDPRFAQIVADLAREMAFEATVVESADEAIQHATTRPPKGIVLDIKLPDHSGLSVLDRLKRDPRTRHVPVHVVSVADHSRTAREMGAVGYLLKPAAREQIAAALRKLELEFTRRSRRLLVVEDDLVQRDAICKLLTTESVEIVAVGTVKEALEALRGTALDCVVTDLTLPDATGYDLLEAMANDEAYCYPSVVVYTGGSLSADDEQRLRRYSSSIIVKGARSPERLLDEVTLFLHQVEATLPLERQRMLRTARSREAILEDKRVLVTEDDVRTVFALTSALEPRGMKITVARNGREALDALHAGPAFDAVLMDVMMPEMDGLEAIRAIRREPKWAQLPVIALTAKAMKDDQERCMLAGASDYVPKPLDVDMLLSLLRVWMSR